MSTTSSSSRNYSIVEPHPSVPSTQYFSTGRGGAGNRVRAPVEVTRGSDASGPASRVALTQSQTSRKSFTTGRGGAGNVHPSSERAIFSFDEELERQLTQERRAAPVYHVGRGGAGNVSVSGGSSSVAASRHFDDERRRSVDSRGSFASTASSESGADYLNRNLKRGFKKMWGH
ncbi:hypothetical protein B0A52_00707 [Exophiala mesophila]|uniref:Uncharacterized protein n=1 Tax=Exophiala mesophila TaxID=212818 RepID=A0A438NHZ8_EXOME|nr:hypothetical protein B0A52_00707 [Exophiala mesophila]